MSDENKPEQPQPVGTGNGAKLPARITTYVIAAMAVLGIAGLAAGTYLAASGNEATANQGFAIATALAGAMASLLANANK